MHSHFIWYGFNDGSKNLRDIHIIIKINNLEKKQSPSHGHMYNEDCNMFAKVKES